MKSSYKERKPRVLPTAGNHDVRLIAIVDLGTQTTTFMGETKEQRKAHFIWELMDEKHVFDEKKGEQPFAIHDVYTNSLDDKANLRKMIESWKSRNLTEDEILGFDLFTLVPKMATANIVHKEATTGKYKGETFANIGAITPAHKNAKSVKPYNPVCCFDFEGPCYWNDPKKENPLSQADCIALMEKNDMYKFIIKKASESPEWTAMMTGETKSDEGYEQSDTPDELKF